MRAVWLLVAAPALALAGEADLDDPPPDAKLVSVHGTLAGAVAELTVRYELTARGAMLARAQYHVMVPPGGVVIGATAIVDGHAHALDLRDAREAGSALDELGMRSATDGVPWTFAITAEGDRQDEVALSVGAPHATTALVDLVVEAPTCFDRDARYAQIDPAWHVAHAIHDADIDVHCGAFEADQTHAWLRFADAVLAKQPSGETRIATTADRLALPSTEVARVEVDVAGVLADVPNDLYTAIVIDNSRSVDDREQWEQTMLVASYLSKAPAGHVQVIAYDRRARALLPAWTIAASARAMIAKSLRVLVAANGSNLDAGFAEAERWLADVRGTKRIIAFSDEQLPSRVDPEAIVVPSDILVHTIALRGKAALIDRDDNSVLARIAARTEGVGFATAGDRDDPSQVMDATELVRPVAFENVEVIAPDRVAIHSVDAAACDGQTLRQGQSCTWWATGGAATPIHVTGRVWGHAIDRELAPSGAHAIELARDLLGGYADDRLQAELAVAARAVDPVWSLVASWGGSGGYADRVGLGVTTDVWGCGCDGPGRIGFGGRGARPIVTTDSLEAQLARATRACTIPDGGIAAELELTDDEIVAVTLDSPAPCVSEAIWNANVLTGTRGHRVVHVAVR